MLSILSRLKNVTNLMTPRFYASISKKVGPDQWRYQLRHQHNDVGILGVPLNMGQCKVGVKYGPNVIRDAGLISALSTIGRPIMDYGDISFEVDHRDDDQTAGYLKYPRTLGTALRTVSDSVYSIVGEQQQTCIVLGGDHSLAIGSLHGHARAKPDLCVLWIDAHADINLPQTSPSGNPHGMVMSFLCKETQKYLPKIPGFEWCTPCIDASRIAYIGLRDLDPAESHGIAPDYPTMVRAMMNSDVLNTWDARAELLAMKPLGMITTDQ